MHGGERRLLSRIERVHGGGDAALLVEALGLGGDWLAATCSKCEGGGGSMARRGGGLGVGTFAYRVAGEAAGAGVTRW